MFSDPVFMLFPEELLQMLNLTVCLASFEYRDGFPPGFELKKIIRSLVWADTTKVTADQMRYFHAQPSNSALSHLFPPQ